MNKLIQSVKQFMNNEEGVTAIEYGLIAALIAVVIIGTVQTSRTQICLLCFKQCPPVSNQQANFCRSYQRTMYHSPIGKKYL